MISHDPFWRRAVKEALKSLTTDQFFALAGNLDTGQKGILSIPQTQLLKMAIRHFMDEEEDEEEALEEIRKSRQMGGVANGGGGGTNGGGEKN